MAVTGAYIHPIYLNNHEQVADYRIIDNQNSHSYPLYFCESKYKPMEQAEALH